VTETKSCPRLAITLHRPWPWAIFHLPMFVRKPVENRGWKPPEHILGQDIAIHAGKVFSDSSVPFIQRVLDGFIDPADEPHYPVDWQSEPVRAQGIIGVVQCFGFARCDDPEDPDIDVQYGGPCSRSNAIGAVSSPWYVPGQYAWLLWKPRLFAEPVPCRGAQGLWTIPDDVYQRCVDQAAAGAVPLRAGE
jgi:hypothetical protein